MYAFKTGNFGKKTFVFMLVFWYRLCTHTILVILETSPSVYVFDVVEGIYACTTGHFCNGTPCLRLCCCSGYVHMHDFSF